MILCNSEKYRVAVVSYLNDPVKMPSSAFDRLYSWSDYDAAEVGYFDASQINLLRSLKIYNPDIIVLDATFLRRRWSPSEIGQTTEILKSISNLKKFTIAAPLDEPNHPDILEHFYLAAGVQRVLTCARDEDIPSLYVNTFNKLEYIKVLPTLIRPSTERRFKKHRNWANRKIDISYRGYILDHNFDEKSKLKQNLALAVARVASEFDFNVSISLDPANLILNQKSWAKHLNDSKVVCGAESGMSKMICANSKDARNGKEIDYMSISSRHVEASLSSCCQLLIEGNYSGVLKSDIDYISIKPNLEDNELIKKIQLSLSMNSSYFRERALQAVIADERLKVDYYVERALQGLPKRRVSLSFCLRRSVVRINFVFRLLEINASRIAMRARKFSWKKAS